MKSGLSLWHPPNILIREMMLNKKQIQAIFLFDFKMGWKAGEKTHNISNIFGPGTANKCAVQWWFKKFCKGEERFEDEELSGQPSEVDNGQLRSILPMRWPGYWSFSSNYTRSCQRNQSTILWFLQPLKQVEKVKKFSKWVPRELTTNQKNCYLEMPFSLILCNNNEPFPDWIVMYFPKSNLPAEKVMVTVWWSASRLIHYSFLNPCETVTSKYAQQIIQIHQKLQRLQLSLVNRRAQFSTATPDHTILITFARKMLPHPQDAENAFQEFNEFGSADFYIMGIEV
ncbi:hypothetical protein FD755_010022, partial [Muntiacus reevesi]